MSSCDASTNKLSSTARAGLLHEGFKAWPLLQPSAGPTTFWLLAEGSGRIACLSQEKSVRIGAALGIGCRAVRASRRVC